MICIKSWSSKCHKVTPVPQTLSSSLVIVAGEIARPFLPLKRLGAGSGYDLIGTAAVGLGPQMIARLRAPRSSNSWVGRLPRR